MSGSSARLEVLTRSVVLGMKRVFRKYKAHLSGVSKVALKPGNP